MKTQRLQWNQWMLLGLVIQWLNIHWIISNLFLSSHDGVIFAPICPWRKLQRKISFGLDRWERKKERKNEEVERTLCLYCSLWSEVLLLSVCLAPQLPPHVDRRGNYCCKALPSNLFKQLNVLSLLLSLKQTPSRSLSYRHTHTHARIHSLSLQGLKILQLFYSFSGKTRFLFCFSSPKNVSSQFFSWDFFPTQWLPILTS